MSKKIKYTDEPIGKVRVIEDFLPSPSELARKRKTVKITLSLTKESLDYFKEEAKANHTPYQKIIRTVLDKYAAHYNVS